MYDLHFYYVTMSLLVVCCHMTIYLIVCLLRRWLAVSCFAVFEFTLQIVHDNHQSSLRDVVGGGLITLFVTVKAAVFVSYCYTRRSNAPRC